MFDVTIVGGGFCGTMSAVRLMRAARTAVRIRLVEQTPRQLSRGIAYSTIEQSHLLNVPAGRMSAFPDDPDHFFRWATAHAHRAGVSHPITPDAFLPRKFYGDYLAHLLDDAISNPGPHTLEVVTDKVTGLRFPREDTVEVRTKTGSRWQSDACVLAVGNTTPETPPAWARSAQHDGRYHNNPWADDVVPSLLESRSCLLLGSGLTMLDLVVALDQRGYQGTIHVLSRRGLIPLAHAPATARKSIEPPPAVLQPEPSVRELFAQLRQLAAGNGGGSANWQAAVDALRPHTQLLWQRLSHTEKHRFLRHARSYWDHHRHRVAPAVRQRFDEMVDSGRVQLHVGQVEGITYRPLPEPAVGAIVRRRKGGKQTLYADHVVNCTGPGATISGCNAPLWRTLWREYSFTKDNVGLGMAVNAEMRLCGQAAFRVFALGPPVKGHLWESTAVPECQIAVGRVISALIEDL